MPEVLSKSATEVIKTVVESGRLHDQPIACIACSNSTWRPVQNECACQAHTPSKEVWVHYICLLNLLLMAKFKTESAMLLQLFSCLAEHSTKTSATAAPTTTPTQAFGLCKIIVFTLHKLMKCRQMLTVHNVKI